MAKRKKICAFCKFYKNLICRQGNIKNTVFAENAACRQFVEKQRDPEPGEAPFCGDFCKCNNAEGCDGCWEFEQWRKGEKLNESL